MLRQLFVKKPDERELYPEVFQKSIPKITLGGIISQAILKTAVLIIAIWFVFEQLDLFGYWWIALFLIWFFAIYPAFRQYDQYRSIEERLRNEILCASCRHYDSTGILCTLHDEHVSVNHIPCGGMDWEWKPPEEE